MLEYFELVRTCVIFDLSKQANMTTVTTYKGIEYTDQDIAAMREWISDCQWADLDADGIDELSAIEVLQGVERNVDGGLVEFMSSML